MGIVENNREMTDSVVKEKKKKVRSKKVEKEDESEKQKIAEKSFDSSNLNQEIEDNENKSDQETIENEPDLIFDQTLDPPENEPEAKPEGEIKKKKKKVRSKSRKTGDKNLVTAEASYEAVEIDKAMQNPNSENFPIENTVQHSVQENISN